MNVEGVDFAVQPIVGHGMALVALRAFHPGEVVVTEVPLGQLPAIPSDVYDDDRLFDRNSEFNGFRLIQRMYDNMTPDQKALYEALHSTTKRVEDIMQINCFPTYSEHDGNELVTLRIYNCICRANNSCRPNAIFSYNEERNEATLRALRPIAAGDEVFTEYQGEPTMALRRVEARNEHFRAVYGFTYDCPACTLPERGEDSKRRYRAGQLLASIEHELTPNNGGSEAGRLQRLRRADKYIGLLQELHVCDYKLAFAYEHRAKIHEQGFELAQRDGIRHCPKCQETGTPLSHPEQAYLDLDWALYYTNICYGFEHRYCRALEDKKINVRTPGLSLARQ